MSLPKKRRVKANDGENEVVPGPCAHVNQKQEVFRSPNTTPMLFPEIWEKILGYLPQDDLKTVINTCMEWNQLMGKEKTTVLFPQVMDILKFHLRYVDVLPIRRVSKTWKAAADASVPDFAIVIETRFRLEQAEAQFKARIRF